jgi:hypothetical protein
MLEKTTIYHNFDHAHRIILFLTYISIILQNIIIHYFYNHEILRFASPW